VARFNQKLLPGRSYTLTVKFDELEWAKSNIYWDDSAQKLTFVPASGSTAYQGYQGVFFRWGSLVGISPAQKSGSNDTEKDAFDGTVPLYIPVVKSQLNTSTWKATNGNSTGADTDIDVSVRHNYTVWSNNSYDVYNETPKRGDIPYMDPGRGGASEDRSNTWLIDAERNNLETYKGLRGDICQYIGATTADNNLKGYRLPASYEFGTKSDDSWGTPNANGWQKYTSNFVLNNGAGYPNGRADLLSSVQSANFDSSKNSQAGAAALGSSINKTMGDVVFPASGYRVGINDGHGFLTRVGTYGLFLSGSAGGSLAGSYLEGGYRLLFYVDNVIVDVWNYRSYAAPVRCVKN
jgi:hypothetical protein